MENTPTASVKIDTIVSNENPPDSISFFVLDSIIRAYDSRDSLSNAEPFERYLRALAAVVQDSAGRDLNWWIFLNAFKTAEYAEPLAFQESWHNITYDNIEEARNQGKGAEATVLFLCGLAAERRQRNLEYEEKLAAARAKNPKIPYILLSPDGKFTQWHNWGIKSISSQFSYYQIDATPYLDSRKNDYETNQKKMMLGPRDLHWTFIIDFFTIGMGYE